MKNDLEKALTRLRVLSAQTPIREVVDALGEGADLHFVGGTVRDSILGRENVDLDLATAFSPDDVRGKLEAKGIHVVPTGLKHQTVTVVINEEHVEVTTFRSAGMRPTGGVIQGGSIEEDLLYRDFTINALAYSIKDDTIIDPTTGITDLEKHVVRTVGSPMERFEEDPLRLLRFVRIAVQLGFSIDEKSARAAQILAEKLSHVSPERVRDELVRILLSPEPRRGFTILVELGLLRYALPELEPAVGCDQNRFHSADVFNHTLDVVEKTEPELVLRLGALLHDIGKPHTISIDEITGDRHFFKHETVGAEITNVLMKRLRFPNEIVEAVTLLVRTHMRPIEVGLPGLRRLVRDTGEQFERWRKLKEADTLATRADPIEFKRALELFEEKVVELKKGPELSPISSLAIRGKDLLDLGYPQSPKIGVVLRALHEKVLDDPSLNNRETLISLVPELMK